MHKHVAFSILTVVVLLATSAVHAGITVVDPDAFIEGTDISNAFAGVALSAVGSGYGNSTSNIYAVNPTGGFEPFTPSTGSLVFGTDASTFPHLFREAGFLQLRADFTDTVLSVQLDFISNDSSDTGRLMAYDAGGTLVDSATTASLGLNEVGTLTVSGEIAFILAGGLDGGSSIGLDNLVLEVKDPDPIPDEPVTIPAPGALLLGTLGTSLVGWLRKRNTL